MKRLLFLLLIFSVLSVINAQNFHFYIAKDSDGKIFSNLYKLPEKANETVTVTSFDFKYGIHAKLIAVKDEAKTYLKLKIYSSSSQPDTVIETSMGSNDDVCGIFINTENGLIFTYSKGEIFGISYSYKEGEIMQIEDLSETSVRDFFCVYSLYPDYRQTSPIATVVSFLKALDKQDFKTAYSLQKVAAWGDYRHFSSTKGFGGIVQVDVDTIYLQSENTFNAEVFVSARYIDPANSNLDLKEVFNLRKIQGKWYISSLKIKELAYFGSYFGKGDIIVHKLTKNELDFTYIYIQNDDALVTSGFSPGGFIEGQAFKSGDVYVYVADQCKVYFKISADKKKITVSENGLCSEERCKKCKFEGEYRK